jgi:hypothetical protein
MKRTTLLSALVILILVTSAFIIRPFSPPASAVTRACIDTDGGIKPFIAGKIIISAPALPQTSSDKCTNLVVIDNGNGTQSSWWEPGLTGTHVSEFSCVNTATGVYADTVIACANGCRNGACNPVCTAGTSVSAGKITAVNSDSITVGSILVRTTPATKIKFNHNATLTVGRSVIYQGIRSTDCSVTASYIQVF